MSSLLSLLPSCSRRTCFPRTVGLLKRLSSTCLSIGGDTFVVNVIIPKMDMSMIPKNDLDSENLSLEEDFVRTLLKSLGGGEPLFGDFLAVDLGSYDSSVIELLL